MIDSYLKLSKFCSSSSNHPAFVNFITVIIVIAGVLVGVGTYPGMETNKSLEFVDQIILAIFTFEVVVKLIAENFHP